MLRQSDRGLFRLLSALVIAAAITGGMLYGMNKVAETLQLRDPTRYFRITNVVVPKPKGPAKRPQAAQLPPARAPLDYGGAHESTGTTLARPRVDAPPARTQPRIEPAIPEQSADQDTATGK